ncbi:MAG: double-strand break repair helicase AddA, partial [Alphaproteobacteria bacterium]|nr:double-strand break repair helicase AddA [Alphaproteobacteria bacterium]
MSGFDPKIRKAASDAQTAAAHPAYSVFVEANAGSGKTRVLVDRVVNILLSGVDPARILCVTYTKAAAAEMKSRLFDRLGRWSVASDEELSNSLQSHHIREDDRDALSRARRLFALALETPGGLKIQTIHAFCESLLRRFPLESGAVPGFETLEESEARLLFEKARRDVLLDADPVLIDTLLEMSGPDSVDTILRWANANRFSLGETLERMGSPEAMREALCARFDVPPGLDVPAAQAAIWAEAPKARLSAAADALEDLGKPTDANRAVILRKALAEQSPVNALVRYFGVFFTAGGTGSRAKSLATAGVKKDAPHVVALLEEEADRLEQARDQLNALRVIEASGAALRLALPFLSALEDHRHHRRALDFDDLIVLAGNLLKPENAFAGWVGYKLDGQLAHALIDEAQDTSPRQWDMIRGLTAEFFAGEGAREEPRSLFVVGDEKQSIYSFQGADPAGFVAEGARLQHLSDEADLPFRRPGLDVSFRSCKEVLTAVDQAFSDYTGDAPEKKFVAPDHPRAFSIYQNHRAARIETPGCVELWPAVPRPEMVEPKSIFDPVDADAKGSARDILAKSLAMEIRAMLDRGDAVWQEGEGGSFTQRPVEPRDIAILVWRRTGGFFEEMIRQLKLAGVPVAGADRMVLRDQTVVKDLLALGRFGLTASDDLALAELLKSPFFDPDDGGQPVIDDAALTDLAQERPTRDRGGLWRALLKTEDARFVEARNALKSFRDQADIQGLYALYAGFLNAVSASGETRWARIFARLGEEARDPAEEFLSRALAFERERGGGLARFIAEMAADEMPVKRELATDRNEVQIMTVHASKGLERPVIILPDTTRSPLSGKSSPLFADPDAGLIWSPRKGEDPAEVARRRERAQSALLAEHERLLYVALTRARDRLIVCGWMQGAGKGSVSEDSWHARLTRLWGGEGWSAFEPESLALESDADRALRFGSAPSPLGSAQGPASSGFARPDWLEAPLPDESDILRPVNPSSLFAKPDRDPAVYSPLGDGGAYRYRRGELIHKLLETLPALQPDKRSIAAERFLAVQSGLDDDQRLQIASETMAILTHPEFAPLFGPDSQAEVSLSGRAPGLPAGVFVRGQVDRLVQTQTEVLVIDYKTNRPPPDRVEDVPEVYLGQMAAYRALLGV